MDTTSLGHSLLIIDDDPNFREIFSVKLGAAGFQVETAESGEIGLAKAKTVKPDMILLDMNMPGLSGAETILKLKEDPATAQTRVVFLSNLANPYTENYNVSKNFAQQIGASDYLRKTDDLDTIVEQVRGFLQK